MQVDLCTSVHVNSCFPYFFHSFFDSAQLAGGSEAGAQPTWVSWQMWMTQLIID